MSWLSQPIALTRRAVLVIALAIGLVAAGVIVAIPLVISDLRTERERAISAETLSKGEIIRLVRRVAKLERPSALELDYRIRVGLKRCLRSPGCLRVFRRVTRTVGSGGVATGTTGGGSARAPASGGPNSQSPPSRPPPGRSPQPSHPGGPNPVPSPGPVPNPPSTPGPSRPNVPLPLPGIGVCTPLIGINCP